MPDDTALPFALPAVGRKKVTAAFDGGRMTSDGGVMLLAAAERRLGVAGRLARLIADPCWGGRPRGISCQGLVVIIRT